MHIGVAHWQLEKCSANALRPYFLNLDSFFHALIFYCRNLVGCGALITAKDSPHHAVSEVTSDCNNFNFSSYVSSSIIRLHYKIRFRSLAAA